MKKLAVALRVGLGLSVVVGVVLGVVLGTLGRAHAQSDPPPNPPVLEIPAPPDSLADAHGNWPTISDRSGNVAADTLRVRRRRLTLREIIERSVKGERGKLAGHHDMTYTMSFRVAEFWKKKKEIEDHVYRNYSDVDGFSRAVKLSQRELRYRRDHGQWVLDPRDDDNADAIVMDTEGYSDFQEIPFFLEQTHEFDFELARRFVREKHVIFEITFRPKSSFKPLPSGRVFVDTTAYRIVHEEFHFDTNPFPLFVKEITRMSRFWEELPTGEWVFTKMLFEVKLRNVTFGYAPDRVAVVLLRRDFAFDTGYDERLFGDKP